MSRSEFAKHLVQKLHDAGVDKVDADATFSETIPLEERLRPHEKDREWYVEATKSRDEWISQ